MEKEYILCAAIWYPDIVLKRENIPNQNPINISKGMVFCGHRHAHCMYSMVAITGLRSVPSEVGEETQGFLTNKNRFVDREEAAIIHKDNGGTLKYSSTELFSEDLY